MENYYIVTFKNTHDAISGESVLKKKNIKIEVMPTPTVITKSCGICIKFNGDNIDQIKDFIKEGSINIKNVYIKDQVGYKVLEV